jgi:hypothetical protein
MGTGLAGDGAAVEGVWRKCGSRLGCSVSHVVLRTGVIHSGVLMLHCCTVLEGGSVHPKGLDSHFPWVICRRSAWLVG